MPKAKPTQVITHRLEFQEKERKLLEGYVWSKSFAMVAPALIAASGIGLAGYALYLFLEEVYGLKDRAEEVAKKAWSLVKDPFTIDPLTDEQLEQIRENRNSESEEEKNMWNDNLFYRMYEDTKEEWGL